MTIWDTYSGHLHCHSLKGTIYRLVESQEQVATLDYVDTLAEQAVLEQLLDDTKPTIPHDDTSYHYLLRTPFRYPPLEWGSRFGSVLEPSIFYGAIKPETSLAEAAYYRYLFLSSMDGVHPKSSIRSQHTLFSASFATQTGLRLSQAPFLEAKGVLTNKQNYDVCQRLGQAMRANAVEAFDYISARDPNEGICVGIYYLHVLTTKTPLTQVNYLCEVSLEEVSFKSTSEEHVTVFSTQQLL